MNEVGGGKEGKKEVRRKKISTDADGTLLLDGSRYRTIENE